jgi:hypothetical protein
LGTQSGSQPVRGRDAARTRVERAYLARGGGVCRLPIVGWVHADPERCARRSVEWHLDNPPRERR